MRWAIAAAVAAGLFAAQPAAAQADSYGAAVTEALRIFGIGGACSESLSGTQAEAKACEWTGACGAVGDVDCSNTCVASASVLALPTSPGTPPLDASLEGTAVVTCNYLATLVATINARSGRRRLAQLSLPPGLKLTAADACPTDAEVDAAAGSALFGLAKAALLNAVGADADVIDATATAEGLKQFLADHCITGDVQPPLATLFTIPTDPNNATAGGSFCRDNSCRLERRFGGLPPGAIEGGAEGIRDAVQQLVEGECVAVADAPGGQCTPNAVFLDARCLAAVLPRFSPAPVSNVTVTDVAPAVQAFTALQRACGQQTSEAACTGAALPSEAQAATDAFASAYNAIVATDVPAGCPAGTELGPALPPGAVPPAGTSAMADSPDADDVETGGPVDLPPSTGGVTAPEDTGGASGSESGGSSATTAAGEADGAVGHAAAAAAAAALAACAALFAL